MQPVALNSMT